MAKVNAKTDDANSALVMIFITNSRFESPHHVADAGKSPSQFSACFG
jgi:hypothetical protein